MASLKLSIHFTRSSSSQADLFIDGAILQKKSESSGKGKLFNAR